MEERMAYEVREIWQKRILPLSRATVYELIAANKLRHIRVGRKILVPVSAVEEFLKTGA